MDRYLYLSGGNSGDYILPLLGKYCGMLYDPDLLGYIQYNIYEEGSNTGASILIYDVSLNVPLPVTAIACYINRI